VYVFVCLFIFIYLFILLTEHLHFQRSITAGQQGTNKHSCPANTYHIRKIRQ